MTKEAIKPQVETIVQRESKAIRDEAIDGAALTSVSRAAFMAARCAEVVVSDDHTVQGIADMLGVEPAPQFGDVAFRDTYIHEQVSEQERQRYGYEDLPASLITDVNQTILECLTEYDVPDPAKLLAARTMLLVRAKPHILAHELRIRLAEMNEDGVFVVRGGMPVHTIIKMDGVVTIAHEMTARYFMPKADVPQQAHQVIEQTEKVMA